MNTEHPQYPGHFFYPAYLGVDMVELTLDQRRDLLADEGNYMCSLTNMRDEFQRTDLLCACDNARIPTHRDRNAPPLRSALEKISLLTQPELTPEARRTLLDRLSKVDTSQWVVPNKKLDSNDL